MGGVSVSTVPCKYEDLSSGPKSADTKLSVTVYACDSIELQRQGQDVWSLLTCLSCQIYDLQV